MRLKGGKNIIEIVGDFTADNINNNYKEQLLSMLRNEKPFYIKYNGSIISSGTLYSIETTCLCNVSHNKWQTGGGGGSPIENHEYYSIYLSVPYAKSYASKFISYNVISGEFETL